jgi:hypothetical protein
MHAQVESRDTRRDSNPKQCDGDAECFVELRCGQLRVRPDPVHSFETRVSHAVSGYAV